MRLKGRSPAGSPSLTTQPENHGTIIGSVKLPIGHIISGPGGGAGGITPEELATQLEALAELLRGHPQYVTNLEELETAMVQMQVGMGESFASFGLALQETTPKAQFDALDDNAVKRTGDQTISGVKTFTGSVVVDDPVGSKDAANKDYADTKVGKTSSQWRLYGTDSNGAQTSFAWSASASGSSVAVRSATGTLSAAAPTSAEHVATKAYADTKVPAVTTAAQIYATNSVGNPTTYSRASDSTAVNSIPMRDAGGTFWVGEPTHASHPATKAYVDTAVSGVSSGGSPVTAATAAVATGESTTSTTYTSLATTTDMVTVTVGASGILQVTINSQLTHSTVHQTAYVSFELSGANTLAASDAQSFWLKNPVSGGSGFRYGMTKVLTGLAPGATTVKMKYRTPSGTSTFTLREVSAVAF